MSFTKQNTIKQSNTIEYQIATLQESLLLLTDKVNQMKVANLHDTNEPTNLVIEEKANVVEKSVEVEKPAEVEKPVDEVAKKTVEEVKEEQSELTLTADWTIDKLYKKYYLTVARLCNIMRSHKNNFTLSVYQNSSMYVRNTDGNWIYKLFICYDSNEFDAAVQTLLQYFNIAPSDYPKDGNEIGCIGYNEDDNYLYYIVDNKTFDELCIPLTLCKDIYDKQSKITIDYFKENARIHTYVCDTSKYDISTKFGDLYDALTYCILKDLFKDVDQAQIASFDEGFVRITFPKKESGKLNYLIESMGYTTKRVVFEDYKIYNAENKEI